MNGRESVGNGDILTDVVEGVRKGSVDKNDVKWGCRTQILDPGLQLKTSKLTPESYLVRL